MSKKPSETLFSKEHNDLLPVDYPMPMVEEMELWPIHKLSLEKEEFMKYASEPNNLTIKYGHHCH